MITIRCHNKTKDYTCDLSINPDNLHEFGTDYLAAHINRLLIEIAREGGMIPSDEWRVTSVKELAEP